MCKILIIAHRLSTYDSRFIKLLASFRSADYDVHTIVPSGQADTHLEALQIERPSSLGIFSKYTKLSNYLKAKSLRKKMAAYGVSLKPDIIYAIDPEILPTALNIKIKTEAHLVYDAHEFHEEEDPSHPKRGVWVKKTELKVGSHIDTFITVNASIGELYAARRPKFPPAIIVHNAVNPHHTKTPYDGRLHATAQLDSKTNILIYQGNLSPMRGLERLANVAKHLNKNWAVVLMGDGPLKAKLTSQANAARYKIISPVPQKELYLWTQGAVLGAALYDDTGLNQLYCSPNKLWEYPQSGVALLASDLPEIRRHIDKYAHGWLVNKHETPKAIAARINALSPQSIQTARDNTLKFAQSTSWKQEIEPVLKLLKSLT